MHHLATQSNGLRVLAVPMPAASSVTFLLLFPVGSRYESSRLNGISHFLEHLFFKGTPRRPTTLDIAKELDSIGASYNAFTSKEYTGYYIKTTPDHAAQACDVLSDILYHSLFQPEEVERERGVILEELHMYEDNPMMHIGELTETTVFGDHPLGWPIGGTREKIQKMPRRDIVNYFKHHYRLHEAVFAVAGALPAAEAHHLAQRYFAKRIGTTAHDRFLPYRRKARHLAVQADTRDVKQTQLALTFPALPHGHPQLPALNLLSIILGGNMSSRLFIKVRERLSLAYYVRSDTEQFRDAGYFAVQAGVDRSRTKEAMMAIARELAALARRGVGKAELENAKTFLRGQLSLKMDSTEFLANWYSSQALFEKEIKTPDQRFAEFATVTATAVRQMARTMFRTDRLGVTTIGPHRNDEVRDWAQQAAKQL